MHFSPLLRLVTVFCKNDYKHTSLRIAGENIMFENAKWINRAEATRKSPAPYFRKSFKIEKPIKRAELNVCGLGTGEYYLNAKEVTDEVLITPVTQYDSTIIYSTFDVTSLICEGINVFAAVIGNSWYNSTRENEWNHNYAPWCDVPKIICQIDITYQDGTSDSIYSDKSWKTSESPIIFNEVRYGTYYDARLEQCGWNRADFDDSKWNKASICRIPGGILTKMPHTPIRVIRAVEPVAVNGNVYDFGENLSGWLKITVSGSEGDEVVIKYSERIEAPDKINAYSINYYTNLSDGHCDKYICKGIGEESFEPRFTYHGFRYAEISAPCKILSVKACLVHADLQVIGDFTSDNELLNWAHEASRKATLCNYFSFPTDCPHREQQGWTGDASLSSDQCLYNYSIKDDYKKWLNDFKDAQRPSGIVPSVVPTGGFGYYWGNGPAWDSSLIIIPYNIYKYTGDISAIRQSWRQMKRYMSFLEKMSDEYIVCFGLGDWLAPEETVKCPVEITDTAYYYRFACVMVECAEVLGEASEEYVTLSKNIKTAFRNRFMKGGKMLFDTQTAVACAIYQGLLEGDEYSAAADHLAELVKQKDYHIDCGILGTKYIFDALADYGYSEIIYKMVSNPSYPSYAYWKSLGLSTLPEAWDINLNKVVSLNHHMFSEIDTWLYKHIAGIKPAKPGFSEVLIQPELLPELNFVKAHTAGIYVEWDRETIKVTSPVSGKLLVDGQTIPFDSGTIVYSRSKKALI